MSDSVDQEIHVLRTSYWSARDPDGRAFAPLADAYRRKGDLEEAQSLIQDGLGRHPDFTTGHLVAARVARDRGDLVAAREHLDRVLDLDGGNVLALLERAGTSAAEGNREGAADDLRGALVLDPSYLEARERLEALESGPAWEPEPTPIEDAEFPESEGSILTRTMGDLYARQGFREKAVEVYEHLLQKDPDDRALADRLAELRSPPEEPEEEETLPAAEPVASEVGPKGSRPISAYFEDLLAWVPGAIPIEALAPSVGDEDGAAPPTVDPESEVQAPKGGSEADEQDLDDFNLWLKSLE